MAELKSQASDTLSFLTQRLNWPVPMVRWRAAREIRSLLECEDTRDEMSEKLLDFLEMCKTESEVCAVLNLFLLSDEKARPTRSSLISRLNHPSILADFLLERMYGWGKGAGGWLGAHSGPAPLNFVPSVYFEKHKSAHLPPIFFDRLKELESYSGAPFVKQWAFEWHTLCEQTGTRFTRYPDHFNDVMETRSGIVGQYQQRQTEAMRSAHIRTFARAVSEWNMPQGQALDELFDHIPAISGLFDLEPIERPIWLGDFPKKCLDDTVGLKELLQGLLSEFRGKDERILSFTSPFKIDDARHGHLQLSAFLATEDFKLGNEKDIFEPPTFCDARKNLSVETEWSGRSMEDSSMEGQTGRAIPICNGIHAVPHGHWMSNYFSAGILVLAGYCLPGGKNLRVRNGELELIIDEVVISVTSVWHDFWTPHYAQNGGHTRNGVSVEVTSDVLNKISEGRSDGLKLGWFLKTWVWKPDTDYGEYKLTERRTFVFDDEI